MNDLLGKTLMTTFMHAPVLGEVDICQDALIEIDDNGQNFRIHEGKINDINNGKDITFFNGYWN